MFEEQVAEEIAEHERKMKVYQYADALMTELGLTGLEPLATKVLAWQDSYPLGLVHPDWTAYRHKMLYWDKDMPIVIVILYIPMEDKPKAREIIVGSNASRWEKSHAVNNYGAVPYLVEKWTYNPLRLHDEIEVCFYRPVQDGDEVNGCKVSRIEHPYTEMVLACEKG